MYQGKLIYIVLEKHYKLDSKQTWDARSKHTISNHPGSTKHGGKQKEKLGKVAIFKLRLKPWCSL